MFTSIFCILYTIVFVALLIKIRNNKNPAYAPYKEKLDRFALSPEQKLYHEEMKDNPHSGIIFGLPGFGLEQRFSDAGSVGANNEIETAKLLNKLADKSEHVYIFHGITYGQKGADVDHVVLYGNTIFLIDSKMWKSKFFYNLKKHAPFSTVPTYIAYRDGEMFSGSHLTFHHALQTMTDRVLPEWVEPVGIVAVNSYQSRLKSDPTLEYLFIKKENLIKELLTRMQKAKPADPSLEYDLIEELCNMVPFHLDYIKL